MQTFDRYVLRLFAKVLIVCLVSITGLYLVIDTFNNLDEFLRHGRQQGGLLRVLLDYYVARVPWIFDRISSLLVLVGAMFAVTCLQRTNEMTALMAAGVTKWRIVKPLVAAAAVVSLLAVANRELVIPAMRDKLMRNAQDWLGQVGKPLEPVIDNKTDILFTGRETYADEQRIAQPNFRFHRPHGQFGRKLVAENGYYRGAQEGRPSGYLLQGVTDPADLSQIQSVSERGEPILLSPADTPWLAPDECFVVSEIQFNQLAGGSQWRQLASTPELVTGLRSSSLDYGLDAHVTVHARLVQPFLDLTLFFLGLPLVLSRENRNIFFAAGWCFLVVVVFVSVVLACQTLGASGYLLRPSLAAWCPLILFAPIATAVSSPIWD